MFLLKFIFQMINKEQFEFIYLLFYLFKNNLYSSLVNFRLS